MKQTKPLDKVEIGALYKADYVAPKKPVLITLAPATYLAISGQGAPGNADFEARIGALYAMAYTVKMTRKFDGKQDYTISKLETQWLAEDNGECFTNTPQNQWRWKLMIRTPEFVGQDELTIAVSALLKKGKAPLAGEVRLEQIEEGPCVQMLHVGPYDREGETVSVMQAFAEKNGWQFHGYHHDIYISDPRRVAPEKLKTILRHPVRRA